MPFEFDDQQNEAWIIMMLIASLSVALLSIPSKVAIAQTSPENQTFQPRGLTMPNTK
jgi:MFS superfamily sulfate permease-like transporter